MAYTGEIGHQKIAGPWGNAGGVIKTVEEVEMMAATGVGWVEAGSYTLDPRTAHGDDGTLAYRHFRSNGRTFNALNMFNDGMDVVEKDIPAMVEVTHAHGKPLFVNVAPVSEEPLPEAEELIIRAYNAGADGVILNTGCPSVLADDETRHEMLSNNVVQFRDVILGLSTNLHPDIPPIFVRLTPVPSSEHMRQLAVPMSIGRVGAVFTPNTWPIEDEGLTMSGIPEGVGGMSGPGLAPLARQQTLWACKALNHHNIDVVSSSGITNGPELGLRLRLGAVAGAGSTFFYENPRHRWGEATESLLAEYAQTSVGN